MRDLLLCAYSAFLQVLIIIREILIINITYGIGKSPSAWGDPLHTLSQTRLEVLQHIILGNEMIVFRLNLYGYLYG